MALVSLEVAKSHLRVDHDEEDTHIERIAEQASAIVVDYLKTENVWEDSSGNITDVPPLIEAAVLLVIGNLYRYREGGSENSFRVLPPISDAVVSILARYRHPAMA